MSLSLPLEATELILAFLGPDPGSLSLACISLEGWATFAKAFRLASTSPLVRHFGLWDPRRF